MKHSPICEACAPLIGNEHCTIFWCAHESAATRSDPRTLLVRIEESERYNTCGWDDQATFVVDGDDGPYEKHQSDYDAFFKTFTYGEAQLAIKLAQGYTAVLQDGTAMPREIARKLKELWHEQDEGHEMYV